MTADHTPERLSAGPDMTDDLEGDGFGLDADFRFGDPRARDDLGGCCGKPTGCRVESRGCVRKPEKADWQAQAEHPDPSETS